MTKNARLLPPRSKPPPPAAATATRKVMSSNRPMENCQREGRAGGGSGMLDMAILVEFAGSGKSGQLELLDSTDCAADTSGTKCTGASTHDNIGRAKSVSKGGKLDDSHI